MPHYKDAENRLHFLDDERYSYMLPPDCSRITEAEADLIRTDQTVASFAAVPASIKVKNSIIATETAQTPRRIREALLDIADKVGADCAFLRELESKIAAEPGNLQ